MDEEVDYHPFFGEVLPNGNLRVPTSGRSSEGELWDGAFEVTTEHPNYSLWLSQINDKEAYHEALAEERRQAREQRRRKHQS